jgi:DNA-directed RNA polymerase subunit RPC12/RpoP
VIRYRCPSCRNVEERPDRDAGQVIACGTCGQKLQVPPAPKDVLPAEPLPLARRRSWVDWVWRPAPRSRRENSGETLIRFGVNVLRAGFLFWAATWIICILIAVLVAAVCGH